MIKLELILNSFVAQTYHYRFIQQYNSQTNKSTPKIYQITNWSSDIAVYCARLINRGNISIWFDPKTRWYAQSQGKPS